MKYSTTLTREDGKTITLAANEYIDIDIKAGNRIIASLTLREGEHGPTVFDSNDIELPSTEACAQCSVPLYGTVRVHHHTEAGKDVTGK
jgi:hypothetical protein